MSCVGSCVDVSRGDEGDTAHDEEGAVPTLSGLGNGAAERPEFTCEHCYAFDGSEEEVKEHEECCVHKATTLGSN